MGPNNWNKEERRRWAARGAGSRMDAPTSGKQQQGLALSAQRYMVTSILFEQELVSKKIREKILCPLLKRKTKYTYLSPETIQLTELAGVRAYV